MTSPLCSAREALKETTDAFEKLLREWMYAPFPKEAQVLGGMSPPRGPFAEASDAIVKARAALASSPPAETEEGVTFEVGCRVRPRGGGDVEGELLSFNEPCSGALIRWNNGEEIWKALRNLEVVATQHPEAGAPSREAIMRAGLTAELPAHYRYGQDALDSVALGKRIATEAILSLFSPQSLKASERRGLSIANGEEADVRGPDSNNALPGKIGPRAVPLSTISERWRPWPPENVERGLQVWAYRPDAGVFCAGFYGTYDVDAGDFSGEPCWFSSDGSDLTGDFPTLFLPLPAPPALSEGDEA